MPRRSARIARKNDVYDGHMVFWEKLGQWWSKSDSDPKKIKKYVDLIRFTEEEREQILLSDKQKAYLKELRQSKSKKSAEKAQDIKKAIEENFGPNAKESPEHLVLIRILFDDLLKLSNSKNTYLWIAAFGLKHDMQPPSQRRRNDGQTKKNR